MAVTVPAAGREEDWMRVGIIVPQGWTGEYQGVAPPAAWQRTIELTRRAEALGFDSAWLFDHFHTTPKPLDTITFEAYTTLTALATWTERIRLGHIVTCAAYRNPALMAKMIATIDVISGGRVEVGVGAGWKREEFEAYGYEFPSTHDRLGRLRDTLEILTRMFEPGRASHAGEYATVAGAINEPKPVQQPRPPIMVGGNGREVTWRLAARFADELNLDAVPPAELPEALEVIAARCAEVDRDPATLPVSVHIWWEHLDAAASRADLIAAYLDAGATRVMTLVRAAARDLDELDRFREECATAGADLEPATT
ncbi:MAG TPA: TIGR03560 family F420-dependent LLM class oxidoreductase [Patescibacteria group bacterium]|nr:TIGR03560 family F420-dependent LLM class oxidoreductase [Patescibacteria group bacterium]